MSGERLFAWRTFKAFGGHLLEQRFDTPAEAGEWRAEHFPASDGRDQAPLTLFAVVDGQAVLSTEPGGVTPSELADAHGAWLSAARASEARR